MCVWVCAGVMPACCIVLGCNPTAWGERADILVSGSRLACTAPSSIHGLRDAGLMVDAGLELGDAPSPPPPPPTEARFFFLPIHLNDKIWFNSYRPLA